MPSEHGETFWAFGLCPPFVYYFHLFLSPKFISLGCDLMDSN